MQFGDDWPGVFIRGDNALVYAMHVERLIKRYHELEPGREHRTDVIQGLLDTLLGCHAGNFRADPEVKP